MKRNGGGGHIIVRSSDGFYSGYPVLEENPWSEKYKASIDCEHPKGFSQRAHCAGRLKRMRKNPPSLDFDYLASGSAAAAYRKQDLVEIITKSKKGLYDISRDVVIEARERLPANLKKYLPIIHRKRIDKNKSGTLEFIYEMPFFNKVTQGPEEPDKYTNYRKYGYDYPTEPELRQIESMLNDVMREAYAKAGVPYKRKNAKFDGSYMNQDSLVCNPIFNMGWYSEGGNKIMVFRDPLFAWMPKEAILMLYGNKFPEDRAGVMRKSAQQITLARYLKSGLI